MNIVFILILVSSTLLHTAAAAPLRRMRRSNDEPPSILDRVRLPDISDIKIGDEIPDIQIVDNDVINEDAEQKIPQSVGSDAIINSGRSDQVTNQQQVPETSASGGGDNQNIPEHPNSSESDETEPDSKKRRTDNTGSASAEKKNKNDACHYSTDRTNVREIGARIPIARVSASCSEGISR